MARANRKLTPERTKQKARKPGLYSDGDGLYLRVKPPSAASWVYRYMLRGKAREMGLGSYPAVSLEAARDKAREGRELKAKGIDPIEERARVERSQALLEGRTFRFCATAYIAANKEGWRNAKHASQWTATLETYAMPTIGDVPVSEIDRSRVIQVLEPIWTTKTETARRLRGRIEAVLDWAIAREYRTGENPARWKGALGKALPVRPKTKTLTHHAALPYANLPALFAKLGEDSGVVSRALKFTVLTAARTGEAIAAHWSEIDLDAGVWTVPGSRMKTGREHRVPLSKPAVAILHRQRELTAGKGYVFAGRPKKHISNMSMLMLLRRVGSDDITVHGFRSTFRDWVEESTNYAGTVAEAALAHVVGDKVEAAYRRGDLFEKRRKLMAAWGTYCTSPDKGADVIPMRRKASAPDR